MTTRSKTAPAGNFFPVSVLISLVVLLAALFVVVQSADLPLLSSTTSGNQTARTPFFRGLVYIPHFRFLPFFGGAAPDAMDEDNMAPSERIDRWEPFIREASQRYSIP